MKTFLSKKAGLWLIFFLPCLVHGQEFVSGNKPDNANPVVAAAASPTETASSAGSEAVSKGPAVNLFLHVDKNIYQGGETIWFTGYILNRDRAIMERQNILYVQVVDAVTRTTAIRQRFLIHNGISKGYILLPDSVTSGNYWLMAYTNASLDGSPSLFREPMLIHSPVASPFRIIGQSIDRASSNSDTLSVRYKIGTSYRGLASDGTFAYTVFADRDSIGSGRQMIDASGEVLIRVDTSGAAGRKLELTALVCRNGLITKFLLDLLPARETELSPNVNPLPAGPQQVKVSLGTDSGGYHRRSSVTLHIRVTSPDGQPVQGLFSLSVAASKKIDWAQTANITTCSLNAAQSIAPAGYAARPPIKPDYGIVKYLDKQLRKPVSLALMGNSFSTIQTDPTGKFDLPYPVLVTSSESPNYLSVAAKSPEGYTLVVHSRGDELGDSLAGVHYPMNFIHLSPISDSDELKLQSSPDRLQAVLVKEKVREEFNGATHEYWSRNCDNDYVCTHNHDGRFMRFLNCPDVDMHPCPTSKPMDGGRYLYLVAGGTHATAIEVTYHCAAPSMPKFMVPLQPILSNPPSFPLQDYSGAEMPVLQSTIYWNHELTTNQNGEATIRFYTNDLTGKFDCLLQGISSEGVLFGQTSYMVTP